MMNGQNCQDDKSKLTCPELLIALVKIPERGAASRHPAFMGNCSTISHTC